LAPPRRVRFQRENLFSLARLSLACLDIRRFLFLRFRRETLESRVALGRLTALTTLAFERLFLLEECLFFLLILLVTVAFVFFRVDAKGEPFAFRV
jgi:hypothetical protein